MYHYRESGLANVVLANGYAVEDTPYGEAVSIDNLDGLHRAIGRALATAQRPLTAGEFRFLRLELNLSQRALASLLDISEQTVSLYERGEQPVGLLRGEVLRQLYLESIEDDSKLGARLAQLAEADARLANLERELRFAETPDGRWEPAAA